MARLNLVAANKEARAPRVRATARPVPVIVPASNDDQKDHFITKNGLSYAGSHLIIDLWEAKGLDDRERIETALIDAVNEAGATLLHIHLHTFEEGGCISGVAVLAESHISIHSWPERNFAALDVFMCGCCDPYKIIPFLKEAFTPSHIQINEQKRGLIA